VVGSRSDFETGVVVSPVTATWRERKKGMNKRMGRSVPSIPVSEAFSIF
jgi:hypothetical protein